MSDEVTKKSKVMDVLWTILDIAFSVAATAAMVAVTYYFVRK